MERSVRLRFRHPGLVLRLSAPAQPHETRTPPATRDKDLTLLSSGTMASISILLGEVS
jgi:hypothetical protein